MSHSDDEVLSEQEIQELREALRAQGLSEEEIAEGIAELPDHLPEINRMLADFFANFGNLADGPPPRED
jgi:transcriptional regulator